MQRVRLIDIAQKLDVSTVTVHNALCGRKGVSNQMRERIIQTAKEMGYESNTVSKKKKEVAQAWKISVLIAENYLAQYATYYWKMYQELALMATQRHCYTMIEVLKQETQMHTMELPKALREEHVDGIIVIGEITMRYIKKLQEHAGVPVVFLDFYDSRIARDCVIADNYYGMYQMTELLFEQGIEKLAFVGSIYATGSIMDRYFGFMKAMTRHHKNLPPEWLIEDRDAMGRIDVALPKRMPQAFVCNCDLTAGVLIAKLEAQGYRVPQDVSVIGFDNFVPPGFIDAKVTTYEVSMKSMTKAALDKLIKQLRTPGHGCLLDIITGQVRWKNSIKIK